MTEVPIKDASTVIIVRDADTAPKVLMGQRGKTAAFMPDKFVFPGGAVDAADGSVPLAGLPHPDCVARLGKRADPTLTHGLLACVARELWEETGQILGVPDQVSKPANSDWDSFHATGYAPTAKGLRYIFRAITPPGRPRRFDARFFLADASALASGLDDFTSASDELSHLHWVAIDEARKLNLPFITEVVLAEVAGLIRHDAPPESVPFFNNNLAASEFLRIG
jgi:8-oxo-dGTP pyrophosphatase MutT (NUDIX family)